MPSYTIATAKEHLSRLIDEALAGEPVTITRDGRPVAELRASEAPEAREQVAKERNDYRRRLEEVARRRPIREFTTDELMSLTRGEE